MSNRIQARLTREGWYYFAVLSFIVVGAALCHVNLLVVLGGMMLAPLLINWRMALANLRGVQVRPLPVRTVSAGQPLVVEFEVINRRRWFAVWQLIVEDRWTFVDQPIAKLAPGSFLTFIGRSLHFILSPSAETVATALAMNIRPREQGRIHYELVIPRRGRYSSTMLRWRSCFPLGLVEAIATGPRQAEVLVTPRIGRLSAEWSSLVVSACSGDGERQHRQRANEGDFFAVRPWQSGDSTRWMHWRTTARAGRPMVRQFEREASPTVALVLDPYLPDEPTAGDRARLEVAISFVATALADLSHRDVGQLALLIANREGALFTGPRSPLFLEQLMNELASLAGDSADHRDGCQAKLTDEFPDTAAVLVISSRPVASSLDQGANDLAQTIHVASPEFAALYAIE